MIQLVCVSDSGMEIRSQETVFRQINVAVFVKVN